MALPREIARFAVALGARSLPSAVGHAALVYFLFETWKSPYRFGPGAPDDVLAIWLFEFLFLHSFPFMVLLAGREFRWMVTLLAGIYGLIAVWVASSMETWVILLFFGLHMFSYLSRSWRAREGAQKNMEAYSATEEGIRMWATYATALALYVVAIFAAGWLPMPELGWEAAPSVVRPDGNETMVIAAATLYFTGRLLQDLVAMTWGRTVSAKELFDAT